MGKCVKCGVGFIGTAANPPGDGECHVCERNRLRQEVTLLRIALKACVTEEVNINRRPYVLKTRLRWINSLVSEALEKEGKL